MGVDGGPRTGLGCTNRSVETGRSVRREKDEHRMVLTAAVSGDVEQVEKAEARRRPGAGEES
jgi:hypothetical protein